MAANVLMPDNPPSRASIGETAACIVRVVSLPDAQPLEWSSHYYTRSTRGERQQKPTGNSPSIIAPPDASIWAAEN